jgi:choline-sulfatase
MRERLGRRNFMQAAGAGALSVAMGERSQVDAMPGKGSSGRVKDKPNVLFIMTDQHRWDLMTCAGRDLVPTPNIDRIAERGVRFSNAYCPYPVCVASRMCLLTGLYSHTTGAIDNTDRLDWRYKTMAHHFTENGYLTGLVGKMHFNDSHNHGFEFYTSINDWLMYLGPKVQDYANEIANHPLGKHFFNTVDDSGAGLPDVEGVWGDKPCPWVGNVERYDFDSMSSKLDEEDHLDSFIARESAKFMRRHRDQPFFLVTSFMKPHSPFYPPREYAEKYPVDKMSLPPVGDISSYPKHIQNRIKNTQRQDAKRLKAHRSGYLGNLAFVDTCVGYVYKELEDLGLLDNTIVVYTSDHGEMEGDHGLYQKFCLFEPSVAVPLIVSYPGRIPRNKVTNALTEYFGLYPTLSDLAGLPKPKGTTTVTMPDAPENMDASSFADLLYDPGTNGPDAAFCEFALKTNIPRYMIRTSQYKYIFNQGAMHELYDHQHDPGEKTNLISKPGLEHVKRQLLDQLVAWYDPANNPYRKQG